jgi:galactokinase/mevalonate kinase-like predicted kinase
VLRGFSGGGLAGSSTTEILIQMFERIRHARRLQLDRIARQALLSEQRFAGLRIAANDVGAPLLGGVVETRVDRNGDVEYRRVECDTKSLARHLIIAFDPTGRRHRASRILSRTLADSRAPASLARISVLARDAVAAIRRGEFSGIAEAIREYAELFQELSHGRYVPPEVRDLEKRLRAELGTGFLAAKPPGAGGASSMMALVSPDAVNRALTLVHAHGWCATRVTIGGAVCITRTPAGRLRVTCGQRIDPVGLGDIPLKSMIGDHGSALAICIDPRCELTVQVEKPDVSRYQIPPIPGRLRVRLSP